MIGVISFVLEDVINGAVGNNKLMLSVDRNKLCTNLSSVSFFLPYNEVNEAVVKKKAVVVTVSLLMNMRFMGRSVSKK